jgi:uncharacterized membrane protein
MDRLKKSILILLIIPALLSPDFLVSARQQGISGKESRLVRLPAAKLQEIERLGLQPRLMLDYGGFYWLDLSEADVDKLKMAIPEGVFEFPNAGQISVMDYRFDPLVDGEPSLPVDLRAKESNTGFRLIQFIGPVKDEWLVDLQLAGIELLQYYPQNTYLAWASPLQTVGASAYPTVRWTGLFHPAYRLSPKLKRTGGIIRNIGVTIFDDGNISETLARIEELGGKYIQHYPAQPDKRFYTAVYSIGSRYLADVARINNVWAIESMPPEPAFDDEIGAQITAGNYPGGTPVTGYTSWLAAKGVDGSGITWADVDTGLDASHPDITGRATAYVTYPGAPAANTDSDGHGSHTAGAIFGDGFNGTGIQDPNGFYWGTGAAPGASLVVQNALFASTWPPPGGWEVMSKDSLINGAIGSSNSWYTGASGSQGYSGVARTHDLMIRDGNFDTPAVSEPIIMVFSAGNSCEQYPCSMNVTEPKEAKNMIVVGASDNYPREGSGVSDIAFFSSRGPAEDGRILPNIMAPGYQTVSFNGSSGNCGSTVSGAGAPYYNYCSGTSMAAPFVSGAAVLVADWWGQEGWGTPSPAMVKALLINGAVDMSGGDDGWGHINSNVPDMDQGWGLVNLDNVIRTGLPSLYFDQERIFHDTGEVWALSVRPADPALPIKISLIWSDAAGAIGANPALVNDLDLRVESNSLIFRGNQFSEGWSVSGGPPDVLNNIENVYIQNPSGTYTIWVDAAAINGDGVPYNGDVNDQDFALVCSNCAERPDFTLLANPRDLAICAPQDGLYSVDVGQILGFSDPVSLNTNGEPAGTSASFSINPGTPPFTSELTVVGTDNAQVGEYNIDIIGIAPTTTHTTTVGLNLFDDLPGIPDLVTPPDGAINQSLRPTFDWSAVTQAGTYELEISTDPGFNNNVFSVQQFSTTYALDFDLNSSTQYYWHVRSVNICGIGEYSATYSFTTEAVPGDCPIGTTIPSILFSDDFESGAIGWTHGGTSDTWVLSSNRTQSGINAYHADDTEWVSDQWLESPAIILPLGQYPLTLQFWNHQTMEDRAGGCYDGGILEVSVDNGGSWNQILEASLLTDPYDGPISISYENPLGGLDAWCGDPQDWTKSVVDLNPYAGEIVKFRYRLGTDRSLAREGWYIDDVIVQSCVDAGYQASFASNSNQEGLPGSKIWHNFTLQNIGLADMYTLTVNGNSWPTTLLTDSPLSVGAGTNAQVIAEVQIPALPSEVIFNTDVFTLTAQSHGDPGLIFTASGTTDAAVNPGISLSPDVQNQTGNLGQVVTHTFNLQNTGDFTDTYTLSLTGFTWPTVAPGTIILGTEESTIVEVSVTIPEDLGLETIIASDTFTLTATSMFDDAVQKQVLGNTFANIDPEVSISPLEQSVVGAPGELVTFTFTVTNSGDYTDTFNIGVSGNLWNTSAPDQTGLLPPGNSENVQVEVFIPGIPSLESIIASDAFTLTAISGWDTDVEAMANGLTEVDVTLDVSLSGFQDGITYLGAPVTYTFSISNTGDYPDSYMLTAVGIWPVSLSKNYTGSLAPGGSDFVDLTVWAPADAADQSVEVTTLTAISDLDANVSAQTGATTTVVWDRLYLPVLQR